MTHAPVKLNGMPLALPLGQIFARLGHTDHTSIPATQLEELNRIIQQAFAVISPRGTYCCRKIESHDAETILLEDSTRISCPGVASMLKNCQEVWLAAATIGKQISELTAECFARGDAAAATVCDAVGSECADAAMDFLQNYAASQLKRSGRILTDSRFSPGYGKWPLSAQKKFFQWLDLQNLGLTLTESMLLIPEKSVTALA